MWDSRGKRPPRFASLADAGETVEPARKPDEDIALLAAAAPEPIAEEPILEEEHVEDDDPTHIRTALLGMVAGWRAKAQEARQQAQDLKPFAAAHKISGQADLLELCADQLAEVLHGKEAA